MQTNNLVLYAIVFAAPGPNVLLPELGEALGYLLWGHLLHIHIIDVKRETGNDKETEKENG